LGKSTNCDHLQRQGENGAHEEWEWLGKLKKQIKYTIPSHRKEQSNGAMLHLILEVQELLTFVLKYPTHDCSI